MAAVVTGNSANVVITLIADQDTIPKRSLFLDESKSIVPIGRASKVSAKGFVAARDNAWFDSPVMSRRHAEFHANLEQKKVYVRDIGSLHGTYVNSMQEGSKNIKLDANELYELQEGAEVTLGVPIWRSSEEYTPTSLRVGITHKSEVHAETCDQKPPLPALKSTFCVPDDYSSSEEDTSEPSLSSPLPKQVVLAMKRAIKKHTIEIDLTDEPTGTGSNPVDLTYDKVKDKELIDFTPEEQNITNRHTSIMDDDAASRHITADDKTMLKKSCLNHDDGDELDNIELAESDRAGMVPLDPNTDSESDDEDAHESVSGSEASSSHSSIYERLASRSGRNAIEVVAPYSDDTDEDVTDCIRDDDKEEQDQEADDDDHDHDDHYSENDSLNLGESGPARQRLTSDHDMDDSDDSVPEDDDSEHSSESAGYSTDDDVLDEKDSDVAIFHRDSFDWLPPGSESFAPAPRNAAHPGIQAHATSILQNPVTTADCVGFGRPPWLADKQTVDRLPPLWAGNRTCSRRSLHDVVATEKWTPAVKEAAYHAREPREAAVATPNPMMQKHQTEGINLPTSRHILLNPSHLHHHPSSFAHMGTLATKENDLEAVSSAHDLELKKRNTSCSMKIADILADSPQPQDTVEGNVDRPQALIKDSLAVCPGKRKSDDISTINEAEETWESRMTNHFAEAADMLATQSAQPSTVTPAPDENSMVIDIEEVHAPTLAPAQTPTAASTHTQPNGPAATASLTSAPMHPTMGDKTAQTQQQQQQARHMMLGDLGMRPAKRQKIRNIAERLGYAALGGVSVGAAIVTTLIYTAPTF